MAALGGHFRVGASIGERRSAGMRRSLFVSFAALAACSSSSVPVQPPAAALRARNSWAEFLEAHNRERAAAGVQPLAWDPSLSEAALVYARGLSAAGTLRHSPRDSRPGQGENLWMGTRGAFSPSQMVGSWASEKRFFRPGIFPAVSTTGNWADAGHYSQMIWPTTTRLGCAISSSAGADFLVCRYAPAGNIDGRRVP